jgi:hypothetical protein
MNRIALLLAGCAALGLAACDHPDAKRQREARTLKVVSKLDCPERQGQLKRTTTSSDGLSCLYAADGVEVTLRLVKLTDGKPMTALAPIEAELKALMPGIKTTPPAADGEEVDINLPGVSIQAGDAGAKIRAPGVEVNAVEGGGAEVRASQNVTVSTDNKDRSRDGISARYILASDAPTGEWKAVGYQARGPIGGPIVLGVVKIKSREGDSDGVFSDVDRLIRHNVGGRKSMASITVD